MAECREERRVPYRAAQMFDLVLDVERYREFMPFGFDAEIIRRATGRLWGHQALRLGPISVRFDTRVRYRRPDWIVVLSSGGPFAILRIAWTFTRLDAGCTVCARTQCRPGSAVFARVLSHWLEPFTRAVVTAFEDRAAEVYGVPGAD